MMFHIHPEVPVSTEWLAGHLVHSAIKVVEVVRSGSARHRIVVPIRVAVSSGIEVGTTIVTCGDDNRGL
jgi:hypothetical protein